MKIFYGNYSFLFLTVITLDLFGITISEICVLLPELDLICVPNPDLKESTRLCYVQVPPNLDRSCPPEYLCYPCPCDTDPFRTPCPIGTRPDGNGGCRHYSEIRSRRDVGESTQRLDALCYVQVPLKLDGSCTQDYLCPPCPCASAAITAPCPNGTRADGNGACRQVVT